MKQPLLSVIVPVYNAGERLPSVLAAMDKYLSDLDITYEILVVNDGSRDGSAEIVERMRDAIKCLKVIDNKAKSGIGAAVRQGMLVARGAYRVYLPDRASVTIDHVGTMMPHFEKGCSVVVGSRLMHESRFVPRNIMYETFVRAGNWFVRGIHFLRVKDPLCGIKACTGEAAEKLFGEMKATGPAFTVELLVLADALGYRIGEVPVMWRPRKTLVGAGREYLKNIAENIKIRWWLWTKKYHIA